MPREADILNVNVPDTAVEPDDYLFTFLELHPYYKAQPVPERDWAAPYRIRFDSEFGDKDATEGSDIHTLQFKRKISVTPLSIDMTMRSYNLAQEDFRIRRLIGSHIRIRYV